MSKNNGTPFGRFSYISPSNHPSTSASINDSLTNQADLNSIPTSDSLSRSFTGSIKRPYTSVKQLNLTSFNNCDQDLHSTHKSKRFRSDNNASPFSSSAILNWTDSVRRSTNSPISLQRPSSRLSLSTASSSSTTPALYKNSKFLFSPFRHSTSNIFDVPKAQSVTSTVNGQLRSRFFDGKTHYGSANARKNIRRLHTTPYALSNVRTIEAKPTRQSTAFSTLNNDPQLSSITQRVLESLEKASTPIDDAKRRFSSAYQSASSDSDLPPRSKLPKLFDTPLVENRPETKFSLPISSTSSIIQNLEKLINAVPTINSSDSKTATANSSLFSFGDINKPKESQAALSVKTPTPVAAESGPKVNAGSPKQTLTVPSLSAKTTDNASQPKATSLASATVESFAFSSPAVVSSANSLESISQKFSFSTPIPISKLDLITPKITKNDNNEGTRTSTTPSTTTSPLSFSKPTVSSASPIASFSKVDFGSPLRINSKVININESSSESFTTKNSTSSMFNFGSETTDSNTISPACGGTQPTEKPEMKFGVPKSSTDSSVQNLGKLNKAVPTINSSDSKTSNLFSFDDVSQPKEPRKAAVSESFELKVNAVSQLPTPIVPSFKENTIENIDNASQTKPPSFALVASPATTASFTFSSPTVASIASSTASSESLSQKISFSTPASLSISKTDIASPVKNTNDKIEINGGIMFGSDLGKPQISSFASTTPSTTTPSFAFSAPTASFASPITTAASSIVAPKTSAIASLSPKFSFGAPALASVSEDSGSPMQINLKDNNFSQPITESVTTTTSSAPSSIFKFGSQTAAASSITPAFGGTPAAAAEKTDVKFNFPVNSTSSTNQNAENLFNSVPSDKHNFGESTSAANNLFAFSAKPNESTQSTNKSFAFQATAPAPTAAPTSSTGFSFPSFSSGATFGNNTSQPQIASFASTTAPATTTSSFAFSTSTTSIAAPTTTVTTISSLPSKFNFGEPLAVSKVDVGSPFQINSKINLNFSQPSTTPFPAATNSASSMFKFGSQNAAPNTITPVFGNTPAAAAAEKTDVKFNFPTNSIGTATQNAGNPFNPVPSGQFNFGPSNPSNLFAFNAKPTESQPPSFGFQAPAPAPPATVSTGYNFGSAIQNPPAVPSFGGSTMFGGNTNQQQVPAFGSSFPAAAAQANQGFKFNTEPPNFPTFNNANPADNAANPFQFSAADQALAQSRQIKKAKRRLR